MNKPTTADILDRYLAGKASEEESLIVSLWAGKFPDGEDGIRALYELGLPSDQGSMGSDNGWNRIRAAIQSEGDVEGVPHLSKKSPSSLRFSKQTRSLIGGLIAVLLLVVGWQVGKQQNKQTSASKASSIYTTGDGKQAFITLPDGSKILLNVASRLEVPADYDRGNRTLTLTGEAMFDVIAKGKNPFTVVSGHTTTRVLGTRFLIRKYETDSSALVAVTDGKVSVMSQVVSRDQEIEVFANGAIDTRKANKGRFNFEKGILTLDGVLLKDVVGDLNRWFEADIRMGDDAVGQRIIAGEYNMGSVASLVEILEMTLDITVSRNGRVLTLYSKR